MSQAIEIYNRIQDPIAAAVSLGKPFAVMFGLSSEAQGTFIALASLAENKTPFEILRTYHVIDGKLSKKALIIAGEFRKAGGKYRWIHTGKDGKKAEAEFTFEGQTITESFTIEEAKQQQLVRPNSNWMKTPGNMLRARVLTNAIAMLAPEIVAGVSGNPEDDSDYAPDPKPLLARKDELAEPKAASVSEVRTVPAGINGEAATIQDPAADSPPSTSVPATPAKPAVSSWANPKDAKKVSAEGAAALAELIPVEKQELALRWLENKGWILPKGSLLDLSPNRAKLIYEKPAEFLAKIGA